MVTGVVGLVVMDADKGIRAIASVLNESGVGGSNNGHSIFRNC